MKPLQRNHCNETNWNNAITKLRCFFLSSTLPLSSLLSYLQLFCVSPEFKQFSFSLVRFLTNPGSRYDNNCTWQAWLVLKPRTTVSGTDRKNGYYCSKTATRQLLRPKNFWENLSIYKLISSLLCFLY